MQLDITRAWKDPDYRAQMSEAELALLPENPAGTLELNEAELGGVIGGLVPHYVTSCIPPHCGNSQMTLCVPTMGAGCDTFTIETSNNY